MWLPNQHKSAQISSNVIGICEDKTAMYNMWCVLLLYYTGVPGLTAHIFILHPDTSYLEVHIIIVQWSSSLLTTIHITTAASATAPPFAPPAFPPAMMKVSSDNQHSRHRPVACLYSSSILLFTLTCFCVTIWLCLVLCYCLLGHGDLMYNVLAPSILMESLGTFMCGCLVKC